MNFFRFKRLKIVEQIAIVLFFSVLIPMTISAFIINNINQKSVRYQLRESAVLIANMVSDEIDFFANSVTNNLNQLVFSLDYIPTYKQKQLYLTEVAKNFVDCESIKIISSQAELDNIRIENRTKGKATQYTNLKDGSFLVATYRLENLKEELFAALKDDKRQIYVMNNDGGLIAAHNYTEDVFKESVLLLPKKTVYDTPVIFGDVKNQPLVYFKKAEPKITIIVNTTEDITNRVIINNRYKIIISFLAAFLTIIFIAALFTYYLYINIRQLFKGIIAISKGNYHRRIRLLTTAFTPHEIVFLAFEFNRMASEIRKSYIQLQKNNKELKQLNEFRSNLLDTVSHELRTPLTSIQGYTTRLMRQDIKIDEKTKQKSLRIIKEQSERLKRLIDDLLTIPDIECMRLRTVIETVQLPDVLEEAVVLIRNKENKEIVFNISEDFPLVSADKDRLLQVFVNLLENAAKYSCPDTKIIVEGYKKGNDAVILVKNDCEVIPEEKLRQLFKKFVRMDDDTTRTTRGTGLGLFIVKGLVEAMHGKIKLTSTSECGFCVNLTFQAAKVKESVV